MYNGQWSSDNQTHFGHHITLQYTCEDCVGYGNQPISETEVVTCSTCNGVGWTDLPNSQDITIRIVRG